MQDAAQEAYIARHELRWLLQELASHAQATAAAAPGQTGSTAGSVHNVSAEATMTTAATFSLRHALRRHKTRRRRRTSAQSDKTAGEAAEHAQLCDTLCEYIDVTRSGDWLTRCYGAALSWPVHVQPHRRIGTALALAVVTTLREVAAPLYDAYREQQQQQQQQQQHSAMLFTDSDDGDDEAHASTSPAVRIFDALTKGPPPSATHEPDFADATRLQDWAFLFLTAHCRNVPWQTWQRVLGLSRRAREQQQAQQTTQSSRAGGLTAETVVLRSLLLCATDCSTHCAQLRRRVAPQAALADPSDGAASADLQAETMPAWVLTDLARIYRAVHEAAGSEGDDVLSVTLVLCDAYWMWTSESYASLWTTYYLRGSPRAQ